MATATVKDTIGAARHRGRAALTEHSDAPDIDVDRLLLKLTGQTDATWLTLHHDTSLTQAQSKRLQRLIVERQRGVPLAYLLGEWEFYGRPFIITPDVLIPRPETEQLIEATLLALRTSLRYYVISKAENNGFFTIADVGTGSGCIAITLALEIAQLVAKRQLPAINYRFFATDISPAALAVARRNAERHDMTSHISFHEGDMLAALPGPVDVIVSNPPYVPSAELAQKPDVTTEGLTFEPQIALDGGPDGQRFITVLQTTSIPAVFETVGGELDHNPAFVRRLADYDGLSVS